MLKTWSTCQLQARFAEVEKRERRIHAKTAFGTCIHDALEKYNWTGDVEAAKERFKYTWQNPDYLSAEPQIWKGVQFGTLMSKGLQILDEYHEKQRWESREIVGIEHKFCVPIGEHEVSGIVDLLEYKKSGRGVPTLRIVDYKTTSKKPTLQALKLDLQFSIYYWASLQPEFWMGWQPELEKYPPMKDGANLYDRFMDSERRCVWYHLWGNTEIDAGAREDEDFLRMYRLLEGIQQAVEKEVFIPSINAESCTFCDFKDICPAVAPILHKLDEAFMDDPDDEGVF